MASERRACRRRAVPGASRRWRRSVRSSPSLRVAGSQSDRALIDGFLYGVSSAFALALFASSDYVTFRTWACFAAPVYAGAAAAAGGIAFWSKVPATPTARNGAAARARAGLLVAVLVGVAIVPLGVAVHRRATVGPQYAQSEVVIVEAAAGLVQDGRDPYSAHFDSVELAGRAPGIREHFPYLPGMAVFGLPRVLFPARQWADARVFFAVTALGCAAVALAIAPVGNAGRLRIWQALAAMPVGALAVVAGGDDLPVIALCLLGFVLLATRRHHSCAAVLVLAATLKFTAWPAVLAVAVSLTVRGARRSAAILLGAPVALGACTLSLVPGAATDLLAYPLGLAELPSPAQSTTAGSMLLRVLPIGHGGLPGVALRVLLLATAVGLGETVLCVLRRTGSVRGSAASASVAAARAGVVLSALIVLAPAARPGYLLYPINAFVWAAILRDA